MKIEEREALVKSLQSCQKFYTDIYPILKKIRDAKEGHSAKLTPAGEQALLQYTLETSSNINLAINLLVYSK
jgi:hypothetical protein